ncbi:hypothetical protein ABIA38_000518 [Embleya sp. AB8]
MTGLGPVAWPPLERFEEFGAERWFGVWSLATPAGPH